VLLVTLNVNKTFRQHQTTMINMQTHVRQVVRIRIVCQKNLVINHTRKKLNPQNYFKIVVNDSMFSNLVNV